MRYLEKQQLKVRNCQKRTLFSLYLFKVEIDGLNLAADRGFPCSPTSTGTHSALKKRVAMASSNLLFF